MLVFSVYAFFDFIFRNFLSLLFYPLDSQNTKELKNQKTKMLIFYKQQSYFSQIASKKAKITIFFFMKNSKNNNIILGCSFLYLVSLYPTNRTLMNQKHNFINYGFFLICIHKNFPGTRQGTRSHCQSHHHLLLLQIKLEVQAWLIIFLFPRFHEQIYARLF